MDELSSTAAEDKPTILIFEEDEAACAAYRTCLKDQYTVEAIQNIDQVLARLGRHPTPDLIISETQFETGNLLEIIRAVPESTPMIVSTSEDAPESIEKVFEHGCSDVLIKPINRNELLVKVKRVIVAARTSAKSKENVIDIDSSRLRITVRGISEQLTPKEMQIVSLLQERPRSREQIMNYIWEETNVSRKAFDVHLFHLRKKLSRLGVSITLSKSGAYEIHELG